MSRSRCLTLVRRNCPSGFSRFDLLAVIVIVGVLIAVLLPTLEHGSREPPRRNQCANNLKQMALAALNHEASKKFLPSGGWGHNWIGDPDAGLGRHQPGGWQYSIMFFMESAAQLQQASDLTDAEKIALGATIVGAGPDPAKNQYAIQPIFYCPSRRPAALYPYGESLVPGYSGDGGTNWTPLFKPYLMAKGDYAANGGTIGFNSLYAGSVNDMQAARGATSFATAALPTLDSTWYLTPYEPPFAHGAKPKLMDATPAETTFTGVIWYRSEVQLREISDGTSKTYLFGEKYLDQFNYTSGRDGSGDEENIYVGMDDDNIRLGASGGIYSPAAPATFRPGSTPPDPFTQFKYPPMQDARVWPGRMSAKPNGVKVDYFNAIRFGSAHAGSFHMAFCDGSVHAISYDIDPTVHAMLCDRQDGETIDATQYLAR